MVPVSSRGILSWTAKCCQSYGSTEAVCCELLLVNSGIVTLTRPDIPVKRQGILKLQWKGQLGSRARQSH